MKTSGIKRKKKSKTMKHDETGEAVAGNTRRNTIEVTLRNGRSFILETDSGEWDGETLTIRRDRELVGIYNLESVRSIAVK